MLGRGPSPGETVDSRPCRYWLMAAALVIIPAAIIFLYLNIVQHALR
jgi:hypothetical protein